MPKSLVFVLLLSLSAGLGLVAALSVPEADQRQVIEWLDQPIKLDNFTLASETGSFTNRSLTGRWTIVLFGFLHCPDVCPTSLADMAALAAQIHDHEIGRNLAYVFISVDPDRDTLDQIHAYTQAFHPAIHGVTGSPEQLSLVAESLGIRFRVDADPDDYQVAHSTVFSIIGPTGELRGRFRPGFRVSSLVTELSRRPQTDLLLSRQSG